MDLLTSREAKIPEPWRTLGLVALAFGLSTLVWSTAIQAFPLTQSGDGQYFHRVMDIAKVTVLRHHELPLWNGFECGGVPLWDNPEMPVASPLVYLTLPFSATHTMWIWYIAHSAFGFLAMWLFARMELRLTRPAAFAAAALFGFGVGHVTQYAGGHATLCNFYLFPAAVLLWRRAEKNWNAAIGLGLLFSFTFLEGGAYPMVYTSLMLAFETALRLLARASPVRIVLAGLLAVGVFVSVAACRLFPVLDQVTRHHRELSLETDAINPETLKAMFLMRQHAWRVDGQTYVWPEYASYFGYLGVGLAILGVIVAGAETWWWTILGVFAFLLMLGHFGRWAPWELLKGHVFPFTSMRVPSRFRLYVAAFVASFVGLLVDRVPRRLSQIGLGRAPIEGARVVLVGLAFIAAGDVMAVSNETVAIKYVSAPEQKVTPSTRFHFEGPGTAAWIDQPRQNRGRLGCADSWPFTEGAPVWTGDVPQARAIDDKATVNVANRTPDTFTIDVDVRAPTKIRVNTPYEVGWRTSVGTTEDENKLLVLDLPEGHHVIHVRYWPRGLTFGFVLSAFGVVFCALFFSRRRIRSALEARRRRRG